MEISFGPDDNYIPQSGGTGNRRVVERVIKGSIQPLLLAGDQEVFIKVLVLVSTHCVEVVLRVSFPSPTFLRGKRSSLKAWLALITEVGVDLGLKSFKACPTVDVVDSYAPITIPKVALRYASVALLACGVPNLEFD